MYNACDYIESCLLAISKQTAKDFEVILLDDCSTDNTIQKAERFPFKIVRLQERARPAKAKNYGAKLSCGDILIFFDADIVLLPDSIEKIISRISEPDTDAISGIYTEDIPQANFFSQLQNLLFVYRYSKLPKFTTFTFSSFCAIKRNAFEAAGGYDEKMYFYEDVELGHRLNKKGYKCRLDVDLKVTHLKHFDHFSLLRDYFKKATVAGAYYRRASFKELLRDNGLPLDMKMAGVSSALILLSAGLAKISLIPLLASLSIYSASMIPLLFFLIKTRNLYFGLKSYVTCFEIFLASQCGLCYGVLRGDKNR